MKYMYEVQGKFLFNNRTERFSAWNTSKSQKQQNISQVKTIKWSRFSTSPNEYAQEHTNNSQCEIIIIIGFSAKNEQQQPFELYDKINVNCSQWNRKNEWNWNLRDGMAHDGRKMIDCVCNEFFNFVVFCCCLLVSMGMNFTWNRHPVTMRTHSVELWKKSLLRHSGFQFDDHFWFFRLSAFFLSSNTKQKRYFVSSWWMWHCMQCVIEACDNNWNSGLSSNGGGFFVTTSIDQRS